MRLVAAEMNLALYRLPSVHRSSTSSPSGGGPSRKQSLLCRKQTVRSRPPAHPPPGMPAPPRPAPHRDALWIQVVAVGAVIEVDLVEGLRGTANDATAVVQPVPVLGDDDLAQGHSAQELTLGGGGNGMCGRGFVQVGEARWAGLAHMGGAPHVDGTLASALTPGPPALCLRQVMDTT